MNLDVTVLSDAPEWVYILATVLALLAIAAIVWVSVLRISFRNTLMRVLEAPELSKELIHRRYSRATIALRSGVIEKVARAHDPRIITITGLDRIWTDRVISKARERDARKILELIPDTGLFACFMAALKSPRVATMLLSWLDTSGDLEGLRRIALSGGGESFNGALALRLLGDRLDRVREMTGDPEWPARHFAMTIILQSTDERSERAAWDAFLDPHRAVRAAVAEQMTSEDMERLFENLYNLYLHDPVFEVRRVARARLAREFADRYRLSREELSEDEAAHVVDLLELNSEEDEAFAFSCLTSGNPELTLPAARYLQRNGSLSKVFEEPSLGDREGMSRAEALLRTAASVGVTGFLESLTRIDNPGSMALAAAILQEAGPHDRIAALARRVFAFPLTDAPQQEIYDATIAAVAGRGDHLALTLMRDELSRRRSEPSRAARVLNAVPARAQAVMIDLLLELIQDPRFECRDELHEVFLRFEDRSFVSQLIGTLREAPAGDGHTVRVSVLRLLAALQLPHARAYVLESLAGLATAEIRELAGIMAAADAADVSRRVHRYIEGYDAETRAAVISLTPALGDKSFLKPVRESVHDADPEVRIAAIWALLELGDAKFFNQAQDRLRDPVERVRVEAAHALGAGGSAASVDKVREVLTDPAEVEDVKRAAITGLGRSEQKRSIAVLVELLEQSDEYDDDVVRGLAEKRSAKQITEIVEHLKDAEPRLREKLMRVFRAMGADGERAMVELLGADISSLRPLITEILEETGFVEATIRRLAHRDPAERRSAAESLAAVATLSAFRGIVMAARDPDPEVRVRVTRALEKLDSESGREILTKLESDPDRRVRKYTLWALERYRAKRL